MLSIGSQSSGALISAQNHLQRAVNLFAHSTTRLASMQRINQAADDPAGLISIEALKAELAALKEANRNADHAARSVNVADSGLAQINNLLGSIKANVVAAAGDGYSAAEKAAAQIEVNAAVEAINHIANTTNLGGRNLLDGSRDALNFALSAVASETTSVDLPNARANYLGGVAGTVNQLTSGGAASLTAGDASLADQILEQATSQVATARAELGAFSRTTIGSAKNMLDSATAQLTASVSLIQDVNVASESSRMVRATILQDAAIASVRIASTSRSLIEYLLDETA